MSPERAPTPGVPGSESDPLGGGCTPQDSSGRTPPGYTVDDYASSKKLDPDLLAALDVVDGLYAGRPAVAVLYKSRAGVVTATRHRTVDGFRWRRGDKPTLYGLDRLPDGGDAVILVEGESDVHTLHVAGYPEAGFPVVGIPGVHGIKPDVVAFDLEGFETVYVVQEPGDAGAQLVERLAGTILRDKLRVVDLDGHKDPSGLWLACDGDPDLFADRFNAALADAKPPLVSPESRATAQPPPEPPRIAYAASILDRFRDEAQLRGLVGEVATAQTLYLVLTSRLLDNQVSVGVKGHTSSGKSYTVEAVARFFPPAAYITFTAMSEKALVYSKEEYAHRTLIVYEVVALREGVDDDMTSYLVRSLLSEGRIDYEVTVRDPAGGWTTKRIVKQGPTNLIFTTTKTKVHAENETRVLSLNTDDSSDQTRRVLLETANEGAAPGDLSEWHQLQTWLAGEAHGGRVGRDGFTSGVSPDDGVGAGCLTQ